MAFLVDDELNQLGTQQARGLGTSVTEPQWIEDASGGYYQDQLGNWSNDGGVTWQAPEPYAEPSYAPSQSYSDSSDPYGSTAPTINEYANSSEYGNPWATSPPQNNPYNWAMAQMNNSPAYQNALRNDGEAAAYMGGLDAYLQGNYVAPEWTEQYGQELSDPSYGPSSAGYSNFNQGHEVPVAPSVPWENVQRTPAEEMFYNPDPFARWVYNRMLTDPVPDGPTREVLMQYDDTFNQPGGDRMWRPDITRSLVNDFLDQSGYSDEFKKSFEFYNPTFRANLGEGGGWLAPSINTLYMGGPQAEGMTHELAHIYDNANYGPEGRGEVQGVLQQLANETDPRYARAQQHAAELLSVGISDMEGPASLLSGMYGYGGLNALPEYARTLYEGMYAPGAGGGYPAGARTTNPYGIQWAPRRGR